MLLTGRHRIAFSNVMFYRAIPAIGFVSVGIASLYTYMEWVMTVFLVGIFTIAASVEKKNSPITKRRYAHVAIAFLVLTFLIPVKTFLFFSLAFAFFYWLQRQHISVGFLSVAALLLSSPPFQYAANAFSFPIRLQLASWVGSLFSLWQPGVQVKGNTIIQNGFEFTVDPACMGLDMLSISLLLGITLICFLKRKGKKDLPWKAGMLYLTLVFLFNVISNLIRILLLVQFAVLPSTFMHDVIGLLCLLLYVCIPSAYSVKWILKRYGTEQTPTPYEPKTCKHYLTGVLLTGVILGAIYINTTDSYSQFKNAHQKVIPGYRSSLYTPGVLKLENDKSLLYIKFTRGFYDTEHSPTICWKGSGYEFKNIKKEKIAGCEIFTAQLVKDKDVLHTAWWFGNDRDVTTSQLHWRWSMLKGAKNYSVVNLTTSDAASLRKEVAYLLTQKPLSPLYKS